MATTTATPSKTRARTSAKATGEPPVQTGETPVKDFLDEFGFEYEYVPALDLTKVNREASKLNQARIAKPINEEQGLMYAVAMEEGAKFPPIVVTEQRTKSGTGFLVMDGNHRVFAADNVPLATLPAYVVKNPSPAQVTAFTYAANTRHGLPTSLQDRLRQATHLVAEGKTTQASAAKQLGIPLNQLRNYMAGWEALNRFTELGNRKFDGVPDSARRKLNQIRSNRILRSAAELYIDSKMTAEDLSDFVRRILAQREEPDQRALIEAEREKRKAVIKATAGGRVSIPEVLRTLSRTTTTVLNFDETKLMASLGDVPEESREEYGRAMSDAGARLIELGMLARRGPKRT